MQKRKRGVIHRLEYALLLLLIQLFRVGPERLGRGLAVFFLRHGSSRHRRLVAANLQRAFPGLSVSERGALQNRVYRHFAGVLTDLLRVAGSGKLDPLLARTEVRNAAALERALADNRGVILFSAHFGNWEWLPLAISRQLGRPLVSIARPMDNPFIERRLHKLREQLGSRIIDKQGALRRIMAMLDENQPVYLLMDQNTVRREAVFVDFFGHSAATVPAVAQLHLRRAVPLLPVFLHFEGRRAVAEIGDAVAFTRGADPGEDVRRLTQQLTALIEAEIRRFPEQWFWFHNRWKTQPQGVAHET
jgi:Kdo2-lipid IVA lauroyltransferase/acyltransferase